MNRKENQEKKVNAVLKLLDDNYGNIPCYLIKKAAAHS